jgi:hypothetical protein
MRAVSRIMHESNNSSPSPSTILVNVLVKKAKRDARTTPKRPPRIMDVLELWIGFVTAIIMPIKRAISRLSRKITTAILNIFCT